MDILKVKGLSKVYTSGFWPFRVQQQHTVVNTISFTIKKGEILGLLGPNGAGKTTVIQMLLGTLLPSKGAITYFGVDFKQHRIAVLKRIGYASGYDKLASQLTIAENLDIVGRIYGIAQPLRQERIKELLTFFGIWHMKDYKTGVLSAGQSTRVLLAKAFIADPEIVLLDEPTAALDPDIAHEVRQFILRQCEEKAISVLITSHNMDEVTELCDRVLVLKKGIIIADNTPEELAQSTSKVKLHLTILNKLDLLLAYLQEGGLRYTIQGMNVTIELDELAVSQFLSVVSEMKVSYSHIFIDKPTLEDYFLSISK